jgi:hypothetical protein
MTETSILPVSSDNSQPPNGDYDGSDDGAAGANRRKLFIAGGVAGAVVVVVAAFMLLHGGSSTPSAATGAVPHGTVKSPVAAAAGHGGGAATKTKTTRLPKKGKLQAGRDPFAPLFTAPVTTGTAVGATTTTVGSNPTPNPTASAPVVGPTPTPTTSPTTPPAGPLGTPTYLQLLSTKGTHSATFRVGYKHQKFKQFQVEAPSAGSSSGTVFALDFALISVKADVATIQIGDGPPFQLSPGVARQL